MLMQELQKIGFTQKETHVYLAMLELGLASVQDIAQKAGVNRATTYVMIDLLTKKGLVHTVTRGKKRYFAAEEPKRLLQILEERKSSVQKQLDMIESVIPELEARFNISGQKPIVRFFEGKEGVKAIHEDILKTKAVGLLYECVPVDDMVKVFPSMSDDYREKLKAKMAATGMVRRTIYSSVNTAIEDMAQAPSEYRCIPADSFPFTTEIAVYGDNKVAMISYKGSLTGVLIESTEMHQTFKTMFDLMWVATEKYRIECEIVVEKKD